MFRKILVGYDDGDQAKDALVFGKQLADMTGAELVVAGVFRFDPTWSGLDPHFREAEADFARKVEAAAKAVGAQPEAIPSSSAARGLHELAEETDADLIVVGSSRHGRAGKVLAGSVGVALLHGSPCAVGISPSGYREHADADLAAVVAAFDNSPESGQALIAASALASATDATLKLVSVAVPPPIGYGKGGNVGRRELKEAIEDEMRERLAEARAAVPTGIEVEATLISGDAVEALVNVADAPGTVLVVGSRGFGPLRRVLLGSVSTRLVGLAPCPLIVTPRGMHAAAETAAKGAEVDAGS